MPSVGLASVLSAFSLDLLTLCEQTPLMVDLPAVTSGSHLAEVKEVCYQREEKV